MSTELQGKREKLVHDAREALEEIKKNTDESRAAELEGRHDDIMSELDRVDASIAREARVAAAEARSEEIRASNRPQNRGGEERHEEAPEYREVFHKFLRSGAEMDALTSEERKVLRTGAPQDGAEFRVQVAGTNSAGGYTVPVELMNEIVKSMAATGPMYDANIVRELNTSSGNQINIPTVDDTSGTASLHTEAAALTDDNSADATLGQKRLDAYVYDTKFVRWSMELGQDSIFNVEALLGELLGERLGRKANSILTTGTGSSQPNGIVTAATSAFTSASAGAVTCDELLDLVHSVDPAYRGSAKARFMFNDSTLKAIRKLKDGNGQYIWQMGNIQQGAPAQLLGYAYSVNQAMASIATGNKAVLFGDLGKYIVRKVGGPVLGVMRERFWPDLGIAGLIRLDGELVDAAAVKVITQA